MGIKAFGIRYISGSHWGRWKIWKVTDAEKGKGSIEGADGICRNTGRFAIVNIQIRGKGRGGA